MLCDICGKNSASVHLTEIVDDQMTELHLCEECARKKSAQMEQQFGLSDLLAGLAEFDKPDLAKEVSLVKCPSCKLSYAEFKKLGRLGCGECYVAFRRYLAPLLKKIHGSSQHVGKCPVAPERISRKRSQLQELRCKLQKAIEAEAFEEAAKIRDEIRESESKQAQNNNSQKTP